jgi:hypothetical protein
MSKLVAAWRGCPCRVYTANQSTALVWLIRSEQWIWVNVNELT